MAIFPRSTHLRSVQKSGAAKLNGQLLDFISFDDAPDLLRASRLTQILGRGASIFNTSGGDESTYALSQPVDPEAGISIFLSHNWSVPWTRKLIALSLHFNVWPAAVGALFVQIACIMLSCADFMPTVKVRWSDYPRGVACKLLGVPVFLALLLLTTEFRRWIGIQGPRVFLDKTCIHQTDKEIQRRGISKLGAFLCNSRRMVVLFTDMYLTKLWTVYEFACFLTLHPIDDIDLVPICLSVALVKCMVIVSLNQLAVVPLELFTGFNYIASFAYLIMVPMLHEVYRTRERECHDVYEMISTFTVHKCSCACEEDRPLIYSNIASLMRAAMVVPSKATEEEALAAFDCMVRQRLPLLLKTASGSLGFRYRDVMMSSISLAMPYWLDKFAGDCHGRPWETVFTDTWATFFFALVIYPCGFSISAKVAGYTRELHGVCGAIYGVAVSWFIFGLGFCVWFVMLTLWDLSDFDSGPSLHWCVWANLVLTTAGFAVTGWIFNWRLFSSKHRAVTSMVDLGALSQSQHARLDQGQTNERDFSDPSRWEHPSLGLSPCLRDCRLGEPQEG